MYSMSTNEDGVRLGFTLTAWLTGVASYGWMLYRVCMLRCSVEARATLMKELDFEFGIRSITKNNAQR